MDNFQEIADNIIVELKRGSLTLSVLSQLATAQYGYSLLSLLEEKSVPIDAGTLYPLLRRLEKQGALVSRWDMDENHPRKYYVLSESGFQLLALLKSEWKKLSALIDNLLLED